jgi:hypothetical protein
MSTLPIISNQKPFDGSTKEYAPIFKVGSALDNEDSVVKLDITKPFAQQQIQIQQPSPRTIVTKTGMLKSQDISIQKFYEGLQNRKPGSNSNNRKTLKTPKITMELAKKPNTANGTNPKKNKSNNEVDALHNNIFSPSPSNIDVVETSEGNPESESPAQKAFDIAIGEIKIQDQ